MTHISEQIFDIVKLSIEKKGSASFVVSGGSSPIKYLMNFHSWILIGQK